jgi:hypothetical protein
MCLCYMEINYIFSFGWCIAAGILHALMCTVINRKERSVHHHFEMLVTQQLKELHPSCWGLNKTEMAHLIHLASIRCSV